MVSTCKKRQSIRRLRSELDDFDQEGTIGMAASDTQQTVVNIEGTIDEN